MVEECSGDLDTRHSNNNVNVVHCIIMVDHIRILLHVFVNLEANNNTTSTTGSNIVQ
jgi:hypothetical protein